MLRGWRMHRARRFGVYRKRSNLRLILLLALILAVIYYLDGFK